MPRRAARIVARLGRPVLRWLVVLTVALIAVACSPTTHLILSRRSIARLLAHPPAPGQVVEVDAYFSGAGQAPPAANAESGAPDRFAILSDQPYLPALSLLGGSLSNALPGDEPWLIAATAAPASPGAPALAQLPYFGRFRGRLSEPRVPVPGGKARRVLAIERVVRVYEQRPPAAPERGKDSSSWRRYRNAEAGYSIPQPPGWLVVRAEDGALVVRARQWPDSPITIRAHPGETHHDPYVPESLPPLLSGRKWTAFEQSVAAGQALAGYRVEGPTARAQGATCVLFSAHGKTFELSVRFPLGLGAAQPLLTAYSAVVAGFRLEAPPEPSPTPPVRQMLGQGPFLEEKEILDTACGLLGQQIDAVTAHLVPEVVAREMAGPCAAFRGHVDGVWALTVWTPRARRTHVMRLYLDATNGHELCREEIEPGAVPTPTPTASAGPVDPGDIRPPEASRGERWVEVNLAAQTVTAWEGEKPVRQMPVSTGTAEYPTVTGRFRIYHKLASMTMTGPGYSLPGVPHSMFFHESYALHGAYWHFSFGTRISHGCVNMKLDDAAWLFEWTKPRLPPGEGEVRATVCNPGTVVVVH